jgi:hypothetical protein
MSGGTHLPTCVAVLLPSSARSLGVAVAVYSRCIKRTKDPQCARPFSLFTRLLPRFSRHCSLQPPVSSPNQEPISDSSIMSPTPKPSIDPCSAVRIYTVAGPFVIFFPSTAGYNSIATPPPRSDPPAKL